MIDGAALEQSLYDNGVYDAWQFVVNTGKTIQTTLFCEETIDRLIEQMEKEHEVWMEDLFSQINPAEGVVQRVSVTSENLPKHEVEVAGKIVSNSFLMDMLVKDFFQYARNTFDSLSQVANAGCLAFKSLSIERVDFGTMQRTFNQPQYAADFPEMHSWYDKIAGSDEFKYIDAFCNRTKHTCDVYLKVSMAFLGGENKSVINPFFRKDIQHEKRDIRSYLSGVSSFVDAAFHNFISELDSELPKQTYIDNRFHTLKVYQQKMKNDPGSSYSMIYIVGDDTIDLMPDEIEVLLLKKMSDDSIVSKNCEMDTIYVQDKNCERKYIGKYTAIEPYGDDTLLRYRRYKKESYDPATLPLEFQAMMDERQKAVFYHANPFMDIQTVSDDHDFLARVQCPF